MNEIEQILTEVASELDWLQPAPVYIGGATIGLFLDAFGRSQLRPTRDIDCIVPALYTMAAWWALEQTLRERGWSPDTSAGAPVCRYRSPRGHTVDLLAERPEVQGFAGRWFSAAVARAEERLVGGQRVLVPDAAHLLACKLEAFADRGATDPMASADFEDIVSLLDGCAEIEARLETAPTDLADYVVGELANIHRSPALLEAAEGHLPRGGDMGGRRRRFQERLRALSQRPTD